MLTYLISLFVSISFSMYTYMQLGVWGGSPLLYQIQPTSQTNLYFYSSIVVLVITQRLVEISLACRLYLIQKGGTPPNA